MVNVGLGWSSVLGIMLAASGFALYFLRSLRPKLARDHDIFFAAVALLCGGILFFQGWRQDPILQFGQFLLTGSAIFFAVESVRLRGAATEQARRNAPIVDDERPVSRVYRAELDELDAIEDRSPTARRIRGSRDSRTGRDEYDEGVRRRPAGRPTGESDRPDDSSRRRRPRMDEGTSGGQDFFADDDAPRGRGRGSASRSGNQPPAAKPRRPRAPEDASRTRDRRPGGMDDPSSEYVDYRPIDPNERDNWGDE